MYITISSSFLLKHSCTTQSTTDNIIVGSHVWCEDPEVSWVDGQVTKINGNKVEIQASHGKTVSLIDFSHHNFFFKLIYLSSMERNHLH